MFDFEDVMTLILHRAEIAGYPFKIRQERDAQAGRTKRFVLVLTVEEDKVYTERFDDGYFEALGYALFYLELPNALCKLQEYIRLAEMFGTPYEVEKAVREAKEYLDGLTGDDEGCLEDLDNCISGEGTPAMNMLRSVEKLVERLEKRQS